MERIGQADVITILEKLHQELKAQTRDSKVDQHYLLRKSFHYVTATLYKPSQLQQRNSAQGKKLAEVTHRVLQELFALLVGGDGFAPPRIRILSSALVRELCAGETPYFFRDNFGGNFAQYDQNKVKYFLPVLSELSNSKLLIQNITHLVGWFIGEHDNLGLKMAALSNLIALVQRAPNVLDKDKHIRPMEAKFQLILTGASLETRKTTSTTLFGVRIVSTSSSCNVTEVDGTPSRDFFTCMNNSYDYSEDQILNVHVFSSLYYWIFHLYQAQLLDSRKKQSREDIISKLEHFGLTRDVAERGADTSEQGGLFGAPAEGSAARSAESQRLNPVGCFTLDESFREVVISVCLRVLSQVERDIVLESVAQMRLGSKYIVSDLDWIKEFTEATSMEAVRILDLLCLMDPSLVSCIFPAVKKVYERTANRQSGLVFSAVLQFFVNHGQHVIFDVDPVLHHFFVDYVSVRYRRQLLAMSTLLFLTTNTSKMLLHTPVFPKYYPAIIKLLAWHPRTVASEILPLVPAMVGPVTFTELFHTLLDLPLTAAFMEQYDRPEESSEVQVNRFGLDRMSPAFKTVQQYIMRNEAGLGGICVWETRDEGHLAMIRQLWKSLPVTPRVSSVCKLVPRFLRVYFDVLLTNAPPDCIERVVPLLLQRFASLYPVDFFLNAVHSLIIDTLQAIFQQWPGFLLSLQKEVVDAISAHLDVQGRLLVLHLCWIIGELLSPAMCGQCKGDIVAFFEALEMLAYEAISDRAEDPADKKRRALRPLQSGIKTDTERQPSQGEPSGGVGTEGLRSGNTSGEGLVAHAESRNWHDEPGGGEHEEQGNTAQSENGEEDVPPTAATKTESVSEVVFTPRFISVIIASLTKLGTKFPEFSPRVVLCLLKMRQHYESDFTEGIEFVRDRLADSLQLLRHSAIANSIYASQMLPGSEPDRFFSFHLSSLSSLSHMSHNPSSFTPGSLLHDFELPSQPPLAQVARSGPVRGDLQRKVATWLENSHGSAAASSAETQEALYRGAEPAGTGAGPGEAGDLWFSNLDRFTELRRAATVAVQGGARASTAGGAQGSRRILGDNAPEAGWMSTTLPEATGTAPAVVSSGQPMDSAHPASPRAPGNMHSGTSPSTRAEPVELPVDALGRSEAARGVAGGKSPAADSNLARVLAGTPPWNTTLETTQPCTPPWSSKPRGFSSVPSTPEQKKNTEKLENKRISPANAPGVQVLAQQTWPSNSRQGLGRHRDHTIGASHSPASSSSEGSDGAPHGQKADTTIARGDVTGERRGTGSLRRHALGHHLDQRAATQTKSTTKPGVKNVQNSTPSSPDSFKAAQSSPEERFPDLEPRALEEASAGTHTQTPALPRSAIESANRSVLHPQSQSPSLSPQRQAAPAPAASTASHSKAQGAEETNSKASTAAVVSGPSAAALADPKSPRSTADYPRSRTSLAHSETTAQPLPSTIFTPPSASAQAIATAPAASPRGSALSLAASSAAVSALASVTVPAAKLAPPVGSTLRSTIAPSGDAQAVSSASSGLSVGINEGAMPSANTLTSLAQLKLSQPSAERGTGEEDAGVEPGSSGSSAVGHTSPDVLYRSPGLIPSPGVPAQTADRPRGDDAAPKMQATSSQAGPRSVVAASYPPRTLPTGLMPTSTTEPPVAQPPAEPDTAQDPPGQAGPRSAPVVEPEVAQDSGEEEF